MWTLRVLGDVSLRPGSDGEPIAIGRKSQAALAWLAAHRSRGTRAALIDLLWQDTSEGDARNALRQWLYQLRRSVGGTPIVRTQAETLELDARLCEVDLWQLQDLASSSERADWLAACELHAGGFAEALGASAAFDMWAAAERENQRRLVAALLERLSSEPLDVVATERAAAVARHLLTQDPLDEGCWRALIRLYVAAGCPAKASAAWLDCRRVLRVEASVEPSQQTTELARTLLPAARRPDAVRDRTIAELRCNDDREAAAYDHVLRGWAHYFTGSAEDNALARQAFEQAMVLQPGRPEYAVYRTWTRVTDFNFGWNGAIPANYLHAAAEARELRLRHPHSPFPLSLEAKLQVWRGRFDEATENFAQALRLAPGEAPTWSNAADALMRAGHLDEAAEYVRQAIALDPQNRGPFHTVLGLLLFAQGAFEASLRAFEVALRRNPAFCVAAGGRAAVLALLGRTEEARLQANGAQMLQAGIDHAVHVLGPWADPQVKGRWVNAWMRAGVPVSRSSASIVQFPAQPRRSGE